ncbi:phosphatidylinositol 4-kinase beta isoform X2 [Pectinophora gossypiella]|uniref:phosphatidylinositol 4-kinase beta isoform X2 n=1 Tax=Pectinophora gossypiella TaxID=13191 RepID=UPI00214ECE31|nr:phosphatidylinositol 4-kinase beta isoform X2 [Pectinophora gossypiella]
MVRKIIVVGIQHYEDPFYKCVGHVTGSTGPPAGCGHQRNRSLDSVLQRIPEDITPTSPEGAPLRIPMEAPAPRLALPPEVPAGSVDSGIHTPPDPHDEERPAPAAARSRESLDSGNPEDTDKPPDETNPCDTIVDPPLKSDISAADTSKNKDFLLRLFESKLFDMSMAISYLFNSKEPGVQTYLANKLFSFPYEDVDFYLPQLATMYVEMGDVADVLRPYLVHRCKQSAEFSLRLAWLLTAFGGDTKRSKATKLRDSIMAEEIRPAARRGHHRSQSDASALRLAMPSGRHLGDLASGRAFDNGCVCGEQCSCGAPRLAPQSQFLSALTSIGRRLAGVADKERRNGRLRAELATLDLNLPARVWLPLHSRPHCVLRIPPHAAAVLNSKDKAPYIMYVEILETDGHEPLPPRLLPPPPPTPHSPPIRHTKSEENLVPEWPVLALHPALDDVDAGDCWSHDDEDFSGHYPTRAPAPDTLSQVSAMSAMSGVSGVSASSLGSRESLAVGAGDVRRRLADATAAPPPNAFRHDPADPSAAALKESWESKLSRMRSMSPYGALAGWRLLGCIVKVGDDLRQEMLAAQLLRRLRAVWRAERVPLRLRPYEIICLDRESGLIQPVLNSVSLHQIKKQSGKTLRAWLELEHGPPNSEGFLRAQNNFVESAAAYALTSYLLQLKDRHNGNILLDSEGHIIHIDFGFIFSISPKNLGFESSPFKLTQEFVEVMDGESSDMFQYFKILILRGLIAARKHCDQIIHIVELMRMGGQLACLRSSTAVSSFRARFHLGKTEPQLQALVDRLVRDALNSLSTRLYDNYQYYTNGIL